MISRGAFIAATVTVIATVILATVAVLYPGNQSNSEKDSSDRSTPVPSTPGTASRLSGKPVVLEQTAAIQAADPTLPLDPGGTSAWASHVVNLRDLADSGDLAAGIQLFEESFDCRLYHSTLKEIPIALKDRRAIDSTHPSTVLLERDATELLRLQKILEDTASLCEGSNPDLVEQVFQVSRLRAAKQGYQTAQSCYVGRPSFPSRVSPAQLRKLRDEYVHYAPIFTKIGLERGDWPIATTATFQLIASGVSHPSWQDKMPPPDPYLTWRAVRLNYYRTKPEQQDYVLHLLKQIEEKSGLTDRQMQQGDAWAREMYDTKYARLPPLDDVENVQDCR